MQPDIIHVVRDHAEDRFVPVHVTEDSHEQVHDSKDLEEHSGRTRPSHSDEEKDRSGSQVNDIMSKIDVENPEQHSAIAVRHGSRNVREEPADSDNQEHQTEQNCSCFYHFDLQLVKTPTLMAAASYAGKSKTAKRKADCAV